MKRMNLMLLWSFVVLLASSAVFAQECPDMAADGDWDGDGILNGVDACCFVTSLTSDTTGGLCAPSEGADRNGNGIPAQSEGVCCVYYPATSTGNAGSPRRSYCSEAEDNVGEPAEYVCENGDGMLSMQVPCDQLLLYDEMKTPGPVEEDSAVCGDGQCICYTIGDYDGDGALDGSISNPFDNCPLSANPVSVNNPVQPDGDGDLFGDVCDTCMDKSDTIFGGEDDITADFLAVHFESAQCRIDDPDTCPGAVCAPRAILNPVGTSGEPVDSIFQTRVLVGNFCSAPGDKDQDGVGDHCDNCVEVFNPQQEDDDENRIGNACEGIVDTDGTDSADSDSGDVDDTDFHGTDDSDSSSDSCDTDEDTDSCTDWPDTGYMSFSGGGFISCSAAPYGAGTTSLIAWLIAVFF